MPAPPPTAGDGATAVPERVVFDANVVTGAGVSAGIDMALHLVDRLAGTARAREVKRGIEYEPAPPV